MQAEFVAELLARFRRYGIHTAIETTLFASWEKVALVAAQCSLIYADMKFFSPEKHKKYTGVDNAVIKENLLHLKKAFPNVELIVRTPVIPGINDDREELNAIADFLKNTVSTTTNCFRSTPSARRNMSSWALTMPSRT